MSLAYACNCLNVRLHVASTIDSSTSLTDELGSELMGWKLSLGVGGIVIEQKALVRLRQVSHAPSWATLSCLVCGTQDIFSVMFDDHHTRLDNPDWDKLLIPESNNIIVHEGLKDAGEIEALKKLPNFSRIFQLVMRSPDETQSSRSNELLDDPKFKQLRQELQLTLTENVKLEEQKTRERIEAYKKQQEEGFDMFKKKAHEELQTLEIMISEALLNTKAEKGKQVDEKKHASSANTSNTTEPSSADAGSGTGKKGSSKQRVRFEESNQKSATADSGKKHEQTSNIGKAIQKQREDTGESADDNDPANEDEVKDNDDSEDDEHVFELDEELETRPEGVTEGEEDSDNATEPADEDHEDTTDVDIVHDFKAFSLPATSPLLMKARRRNSQKYRAGNTWDEIQDKVDDIDDIQSPTMYATSLPINITKIGAKPQVQESEEPNNEMEDSNNKALQFGSTYDPSLRDMAASAQFQSSTTNPLTRSFNRAVIEERLRHDHDDEDDNGPMIPPHILAAQAHDDEDELYGTAPDTDR
ncbi:hypothetical protein BGW37DRAFT_184670 [Umbelopsis sp. PMI_123]|nr:hypothetical protein BGW37DRAFT_184670 [Umbelopsis sp. PMI_123]